MNLFHSKEMSREEREAFNAWAIEMKVSSQYNPEQPIKPIGFKTDTFTQNIKPWTKLSSQSTAR